MLPAAKPPALNIYKKNDGKNFTSGKCNGSQKQKHLATSIEKLLKQLIYDFDPLTNKKGATVLSSYSYNYTLDGSQWRKQDNAGGRQPTSKTVQEDSPRNREP